ncbi:MAG: chemotaxis protein CheW [Calditrichae bacterium]|nr:chemotaxis protein CheW [Calditrichia bacterium]
MKKVKSDEAVELSIFQVAEIICAVDITKIVEIIKHLDLTLVKNAPSFVRGVASLRGEIITVIDVRAKFGLEPIPLNEDMRIIVVNYQNENTGLLVDKIIDVNRVEQNSIGPLTSNINSVNKDYFSGIYTMENDLSAILNLDELLVFDHKSSDNKVLV